MKKEHLNKEQLEEIARLLRLDIVKMTGNSKKTGAHLGGAMSVADILAVLYGSIASIDSSNPLDEKRDRIILSKSHAAIALYAALAYAGFINGEEIEKAMTSGSWFYKHPQKSSRYGIECSGGSLGMGLSFGMGIGRALKLKNIDEARVFVIVGDGECNEGSIWEAAAAIINYKLNNVIIIVDNNHLQIDGTNQQVMQSGRLADRFGSIGFNVVNVNGHDVMQLQEELAIRRSEPTVFICDTVKGKGISFAEDKAEWHIGILTQEQTKQAIEEINTVV